MNRDHYDAEWLQAEALLDEPFPEITIRSVLAEALELAAMPIFFVSLFVSAVALVL